MPPMGVQPLSFTVTQLLQNKPGINPSTILPFSSRTHTTRQTGLWYKLDAALPYKYLSSGYITDGITILKKNPHKPTTKKNQLSEVPQGIYLSSYFFQP